MGKTPWRLRAFLVIGILAGGLAFAAGPVAATHILPTVGDIDSTSSPLPTTLPTLPSPTATTSSEPDEPDSTPSSSSSSQSSSSTSSRSSSSTSSSSVLPTSQSAPAPVVNQEGPKPSWSSLAVSEDQAGAEGGAPVTGSRDSMAQQLDPAKPPETGWGSAIPYVIWSIAAAAFLTLAGSLLVWKRNREP